MEREQLDRLLAEYATGGLSEAGKRKLFAAALADQELFDRLTEEDALREAIEMPGARNRLIDSLAEDSVTPPAVLMPSPKAGRGKPMWLAWAAGIGIVFVSGAITYVMFEAPVPKNLAQVRSEAPPNTKPFVAPPSPIKKQLKVIVEAPPKIMAGTGGRVFLTQPVNIPLPTAPPPAKLVTAESAKVIVSPGTTLDNVETEMRSIRRAQTPLPAPFQPQQIPPAGGVIGGVPGPAANLEAAGKELAIRSAPADASRARESKAIAPASLWRRAGDGVWFRVPSGDAIGRDDIVAVRYVPIAAVDVALLDASGRRIASKPGRAREELELIIPPVLLQTAAGDAIAFSITEGPRSTSIKILLRRQ